MLPKQLKDSQRHQRQPKQVELFLQSTKPGNEIPYPPTNITITRSTRKPDCYWRWQWRIRRTKQQLLHSGIDLFHAGLLPPTLSRMHWLTTSIFWMSTIHMQSLLLTSSRTPSFWLPEMVEAGDFNHSGRYCYKFFSSFTMCRTCFYLLFFTYDWHAFTSR